MPLSMRVTTSSRNASTKRVAEYRNSLKKLKIDTVTVTAPAIASKLISTFALVTKWEWLYSVVCMEFVKISLLMQILAMNNTAGTIPIDRDFNTLADTINANKYKASVFPSVNALERMVQLSKQLSLLAEQHNKFEKDSVEDKALHLEAKIKVVKCCIKAHYAHVALLVQFDKAMLENAVEMCKITKVEVHKVEPRKVEVHKVEPRKVEPHKVEPHKVEPHKVEPRKVEPHKVFKVGRTVRSDIPDGLNIASEPSLTVFGMNDND